MFDVSDPEEPSAGVVADDSEWIDAVRDSIEADGHYLVFKDEDRVSVMPLMREWTKIGRSLTADIRLDDPTVSRRHALICRQPEAIRVLDDRSLNGIFLNGERTEWGELGDGDELLIGRYHLYFVEKTGAAANAQRGRAASVA
jgi:pSer/pThr/pTyr-binding forkhead associated (FHA) protein